MYIPIEELWTSCIVTGQVISQLVASHLDCPVSVSNLLIQIQIIYMMHACMGALLGLLWALWSLSLARNDICYCCMVTMATL